MSNVSPMSTWWSDQATEATKRDRMLTNDGGHVITGIIPCGHWSESFRKNTVFSHVPGASHRMTCSNSRKFQVVKIDSFLNQEKNLDQEWARVDQNLRFEP